MWAGWGAFLGELDGGELRVSAAGFLGEEGLAADEVRLGEVTEEAEAGLDGCALWGEVVPIERVAHF